MFLGVSFYLLQAKGGKLAYNDKQQCKSASLIYMTVNPSPKPAKTSAYVGQWGRLRFEGGSITTVLQVKQV